MEYGFDSKVNLLKAWAIMLVVSGHLGISLLPMFPTYSFHMALFFFISGYLFKEEHIANIPLYVKSKAKRLLVPYFWYNVVYFIITFIISEKTGTFYGKPINIKNYVFMPFVDNSQLTFLIQLWFIIQLFMSLSVFIIFYKNLKKVWNNNIFHLLIFLSLALIGIQISFFKLDPVLLITVKTAFSMFFIYLGLYYKNHIESKINLFSCKSIGLLILVQSILWRFNMDEKMPLGMTKGLSYMLWMGKFSQPLIPVLTSITGIWLSLFVVHIVYPYLKNNKLIEQIGKNTFHIMANHILLIFTLSNIFIWVNKLPDSIRNDELFWVYQPEKTAYLYFIFVILVSTYIGVGINYIKDKINKKSTNVLKSFQNLQQE